MGVDVECVVVLLSLLAGQVGGVAGKGYGVGEYECGVEVGTGVKALQAVGDEDAFLAQEVGEDAVVGGDVRVGEMVYARVYAALEEGGEFSHRVPVAQHEVQSVVGSEGGVGFGCVGGGVLVYGGAAADEGLPRVRLVSGGNVHFAVLLIGLAHAFYAEHHFLVIAHAHGFHDALFEVAFHGAV